jgi:hypothetical protein
MERRNNGDTKSNNSWTEAAYQVLKTENRPLGPTELAKIILSSGLVNSKSNSPASTVYVSIISEIKRKGSRCRFVKIGSKFGLSEQSDKYLDSCIQTDLGRSIQTEFWKRYKFKEVSEKELLKSIREEIQEIQSFLLEETESEVNHDQLCFWVWFCYNMQLFDHGAYVFKRINPLKTNPVLYKLVKKIGNMCELRRE